MVQFVLMSYFFLPIKSWSAFTFTKHLISKIYSSLYLGYSLIEANSKACF